MAKDPSKVAQEWASKLGSSVNKMKEGVSAVTEAPTMKAARESSRYLSGVQEAVASGKWQRGLQAVSLQSWQDAMNGKGAARVATGATAAIPKMTQFMSKLLPYQENVKRSLDSTTPRGDFSTNIQRMVAFAQAMHEFKKV